ncbi:hypothetical protein FRB98_002703 [Tulasnella sp. 332]|nr:hypothetical protein FRB98_002703 [Tulasnella sp. 332]
MGQTEGLAPRLDRHMFFLQRIETAIVHDPDNINSARTYLKVEKVIRYHQQGPTRIGVLWVELPPAENPMAAHLHLHRSERLGDGNAAEDFEPSDYVASPSGELKSLAIPTGITVAARKPHAGGEMTQFLLNESKMDVKFPACMSFDSTGYQLVPPIHTPQPGARSFRRAMAAGFRMSPIPKDVEWIQHGRLSKDANVRPPTPPIDPRVAELASKLHEHDTKLLANDYYSRGGRDGEADGDADDEQDSNMSDSELFAELEKDDEDDLMLANLREQRMEALKSELARTRDLREQEHGRYTEIMDEKEVLKTSGKLVVSFTFTTGTLGDLIAPHHFKTRFFRVFVENVPWLVEKLQIKVLPCVVCFIGGVSKDRLIGFEELGNDDAFTTATLELRLAQSGVIDSREGKVNKLASKYAKPSIRGREVEDEEDWRSDE